MNRLYSFLIALILTVFMAGSALAFGLSDLTTAVSSATSSPDVDVKGLTSEEAKLKIRLTSALVHMLVAQEKVLDATGEKEAAGVIANQVGVLKAGNFEDEELDKAVALTEANDEVICKKEASMGKLDSAAKKKVAEALIPYALGAVDMSHLNKDFVVWFSSIQSAASSPSTLLTIKDSLAFGMNMAPKLPTLTSQSLSTTQQLIAFCKSNDLETDGAEDALGEL